MNRLARHPDLAGDGCCGFTLAHTAQQQDGLRWPEVLSREYRPTVQIVDALTRTPVHRQLAPLGGAKLAGLHHAPATMWAL